MTKFGYKLVYNLRLQLPLRKINIATYFEFWINELYTFYIHQHKYQILCQSNVFNIQSINFFFIHYFRL